jgi:branched-subunit amino acid ABC-type transport system permease component
VPASIVPTIAGLFLVLGVVSFRSIRGLQNVTRTADDDIDQLMIAMDHLSVAFSTTQIIVTLLILVAIALMIVLLTSQSELGKRCRIHFSKK